MIIHNDKSVMKHRLLAFQYTTRYIVFHIHSLIISFDNWYQFLQALYANISFAVNDAYLHLRTPDIVNVFFKVCIMKIGITNIQHFSCPVQNVSDCFFCFVQVFLLSRIFLVPIKEYEFPAVFQLFLSWSNL